MVIHCPRCGAQIPADDLNLQTLLARCRKCDNVFSFADVARAETGSARFSGNEAAIEIPRPPRIIVQESPTAWTAHYRWFSPMVFFLIFFCIAWDSFLIFWYSLAFKIHGPWLMIVFPILHVAVGVSLTYYTLATLFNTTRIAATRGEVSIQSGPIPWIGNRVLPAVSVKQLFWRLIQSNNNRNSSPSYAVFAVLDDGRTIRLVAGLNDSDEAGFLQQQLEKRLNVKPSPPTIAGGRI